MPSAVDADMLVSQVSIQCTENVGVTLNCRLNDGVIRVTGNRSIGCGGGYRYDFCGIVERLGDHDFCRAAARCAVAGAA